MSEAHATVFNGVRFLHVDLAEATQLLLSPRGLTTPVPWRLVNTYSISLMRRDPVYASVMCGEGVNLADGKPVAWALQARGRRDGSATVPGHVRGPSLFARALDEGRSRDVRHYLLGGSPETLADLQTAIAARFPGAHIVGAESPPFRPLSDWERRAQDHRIRISGADLVWVGLGTPRQDIEAERLTRTVGLPAIAVGAAFDFLAGTKPEAPAWMQAWSLEWLFRFASEPRRLWHRYTVGLLRFARVASLELLAGPAVPPLVPAVSARLALAEDERLGA